MTHHQAALPSGWRIPDEATLPGGRTIAGTAARVYHLLAETLRRGHRWHVGRHLAPAGWVPTWVLREPWAGGAAGDRRLRDLRAAGLTIEGQSFAPADDDAPGSASWLWHLAPVQTAPAPPAPPGAGEARLLPLAGVTVRFVVRLVPGVIDVSPGASSPLAPSFDACRAAEASEAYGWGFGGSSRSLPSSKPPPSWSWSGATEGGTFRGSGSERVKWSAPFPSQRVKPSAPFPT